jgi:hypothetical protein
MNAFRALLDTTQYLTDHVAIYCGKREYVKYKSDNKTYILAEQLHKMELGVYHDIIVQVAGLDGECKS